MEKILHDNLLDSLKGEIDIMKEVASPYTVRLFDSSIGGQWSYMILELCDSDLRKEMEKNGQCFP
jgi:calcium-dependent protein kinase